LRHTKNWPTAVEEFKRGFNNSGSMKKKMDPQAAVSGNPFFYWMKGGLSGA